MKTILVPTDFSDAAKNAAIYALKLAGQMNGEKVILYNAYQIIIPVPDYPSLSMIDATALHENSLESLKKFKSDIIEFCPENVKIQTLAEFNLLATKVDEVCQRENVDLIIMGITGGSKLKEVLVGSNTIDVINNTTVPVIVVPPDARFTKIEEVVFACDFNKVVEKTPIAMMKVILDTFKPKLYVLNIDHNNKGFTPDTPFESLMLDTLLQGYNPEYHFIDNPDFLEGINDFAQQKLADLIITIPKKHGLFESMFKRSHIKQLVYHSHIPVLAIHESEL